MKTNLIKIFTGEYSNPDAYERVVGYLLQKPYKAGYGFTFPLLHTTVVRQLEASLSASDYNSDRLLWHFIISIPNIKNHTSLLLFADKIASLFAKNYQVLYSLDLDPGHFHLHFAVNAYSYHPHQPILSDDNFANYIILIKDYVSNCFPKNNTIIEWEGGPTDV